MLMRSALEEIMEDSLFMLATRWTEWGFGNSNSMQMLVEADMASTQLCEYRYLFPSEICCHFLEPVRGHRRIDLAKMRGAWVAAEE